MRRTIAATVALPLLLAAAVGAAALRQPGGADGAYANSMGTVYQAPVLGTSAALPAAQSLPRLLSETSSLPPAHRTPVVAVRAPAVPVAGFDVRSQPSISPSLINLVLEQYGSPMSGDGQQLYDLGVKYGIDPAFCLAFFINESAAGTRGEAVLTHNLGNIRAVAGAPSLDGYRYYATWLEGAEDWYRLISTLYVKDWGLTTADAIIPVYAPAGDANDPRAYIRNVEQLVAQWRAQS